MLELGETLREAAVREAREETCLTVEPAELLGVYDRVLRDDDGRTLYHYVLIDFYARAGRRSAGSRRCRRSALVHSSGSCETWRWPKTPPKSSAWDSGSPFPGSRYNLAFNGGHAAYSRHTLGSSEMVAPTGARSGQLTTPIRPAVQRFMWCCSTGPGGRWQVSTVGRGSLLGRWARILFYVTVDARLVGVEYGVEGTNFKSGKSRMLFGTTLLGQLCGTGRRSHGQALISGHDGWGTLRLSADPGYELDRVVEALIEFKRKRNGPHVFQHAGRPVD